MAEGRKSGCLPSGNSSLTAGIGFTLNGRLRDKCLNERLFDRLSEARSIIETWVIDDNTFGPHTSLDGLAPAMFADQAGPPGPNQKELRTESPIKRPGSEGWVNFQPRKIVSNRETVNQVSKF